jgi:phosphate:Na+ symporter
VRAAQLCADAMRSAATAAGQVADPPAGPGHAAAAEAQPEPPLSTAPAKSTDEALARLELCTTALADLQRTHRAATLGAAASGALTADEAIVRVDTVRRLDALSHHAWRCIAHLLNSRG